jgi:hypothetical protein
MNHTQMTTQDLINKYTQETITAVGLLYRNKLFGHMLVLLYSSIDSLGLLDAPPTQTSATGESFKNWVKNYIIVNPNIEYDEVDFWAARCAVLHSFTSISDLSSKGKAREILYYTGPKDSVEARIFVTKVSLIDEGKHIASHLDTTYLAFINALIPFTTILLEKCDEDSAYVNRVRNILLQSTL